MTPRRRAPGFPGVGVFLFFGLAFEFRRQRLDQGLVGGFEGVVEHLARRAVARLHELRHAVAAIIAATASLASGSTSTISLSSMRKHWRLNVRNSCSISQRRRHQIAMRRHCRSSPESLRKTNQLLPPPARPDLYACGSRSLVGEGGPPS